MLAATLARTRGSDALFFVDLPSLLLKVTPLADDPTMRQVGVMLSAIPGMATMRAPLTLTVRSHDALAFELALPDREPRERGQRREAVHGGDGARRPMTTNSPPSAPRPTIQPI